jgi:hypothetical protein
MTYRGVIALMAAPTRTRRAPAKAATPRPSKKTAPPAEPKTVAEAVTKPKPAKLPGGRYVDFDLSGAIHDMPTTFLQCRDFSHSWRPYTATWSPSENAYEVQIKCSRCKTVRHRFIGSRGELLESKYDYADGYLIKGMGRLNGTDRDEIRLQSVLRVLPDDAAEDTA